jgi:hypothetical protein
VSKAASLTDQRAKLADADAEAQDALTAATRRLRTGRSDAGREVIAPLLDFTEAVEKNRPDAPPEDERADRKRELIREFFDAIAERGLTLDPVRSNEGFALAVIDPSIDADHDAALKASNDAKAALSEFDRDHGDGLRAERKAARAAAYRKAVDDGDLDRAHDLLRETEYEDVRDARQATIDKLVSGEYEGYEDETNRSTYRPSEPAAPATGALTTADLSG